MEKKKKKIFLWTSDNLCYYEGIFPFKSTWWNCCQIGWLKQIIMAKLIFEFQFNSIFFFLKLRFLARSRWCWIRTYKIFYWEMTRKRISLWHWGNIKTCPVNFKKSSKLFSRKQRQRAPNWSPIKLWTNRFYHREKLENASKSGFLLTLEGFVCIWNTNFIFDLNFKSSGIRQSKSKWEEFRGNT